MTPKEKAEEMVSSLNTYNKDGKPLFPHIKQSDVRQHVLSCVNNLIKEEQKTDDYYELGSYWEEVKQEINKL